MPIFICFYLCFSSISAKKNLNPYMDDYIQLQKKAIIDVSMFDVSECVLMFDVQFFHV